MGEDDEWCDLGEPYFQTFTLRFGSKVSLHSLWIRSNLYPSCDQKNRFTNPILCFFSTCEPSILNHYTYIIYISTVLNVLTPSLCALSSLLSGSADIYKSASSGLLTQIFVTQNVDLLWRRFLSEGQSCQWRHLQMHPRAAGVGTQGYCRWPKWQPGDWNRQAPRRIEWRNKQSHHQEKP